MEEANAKGLVVKMYDLYNKVGSFFSEPFWQIAYKYESFPIIFALIIGLVGAMAPCQFTGNLGALTIYGQQTFKGKVPWKQIFLFVLGKVVAFTVLGVAVWVLGKEFQAQATLFFPWLRKLVGPFLVLSGIFLIGIIKVKGTFSMGRIFTAFSKKENSGSFFMGLSFSLAFCPTMFVLFFITLMPITFSSSYGFVLPIVFALGTSIPVLVIMTIMAFLEIDKHFLRQGRRIGVIIQKAAGVLLLFLGIFDTLTYW